MKRNFSKIIIPKLINYNIIYSYSGRRLFSNNSAAALGNPHSKVIERNRIDNMRVIPIPIFTDNYSYLLIDKDSAKAAVIDPAEPAAIIDAINENNKNPNNTIINLEQILTTHHHWDHAKGNEQIKAAFPHVSVYGGDIRIPGLTNRVTHGTVFQLGNILIKVLFTPCHTSGHVVYYCSSLSVPHAAPILFSGDTLFLGGCGKFFEGTAKEMFDSLCKVISSLDPNTEIYCGHEYSEKNLAFAKKVDPNNTWLDAKYNWVTKKRKQQPLPECTIPSILSEELEYNPFLRVTNPEIIKNLSCDTTDPISVMSALRKLKDLQ